MSQSQHTPEPWEVHDGSGEFIRPGIESEGFSIVVGAINTDECVDMGVHGRTADEMQANAHLIAAAPQLLAAVKALLPHAMFIINENHPAYKLAQTAIAKAEGRS